MSCDGPHTILDAFSDPKCRLVPPSCLTKTGLLERRWISKRTFLSNNFDGLLEFEHQKWNEMNRNLDFTSQGNCCFNWLNKTGDQGTKAPVVQEWWVSSRRVSPEETRFFLRCKTEFSWDLLWFTIGFSVIQCLMMIFFWDDLVRIIFWWFKGI